MTALYSLAEIRAVEQAALAGLAPGTLMQRAGQAAAELARMLAPQPGARVLVLAGPGNNGGDALEAAARLARLGCKPHVLHFAGPQPSADSARALAHATASGVRLYAPAQWPALAAGSDWALAIDGLFGIGLARPLSGAVRDAAAYLNALACPVLALDVPSGLDADTGTVVGAAAGGIAVRATHTITFIGDKPGLHTGDGRDHAGTVTVAALAIEHALFPPARARLNAPTLFTEQLRRRRQNTHKGSYGDLAVLGGAHGMSGAPLLAARAALQCGAGRVFVGFLEAAPAFDPLQLELMCRRAEDLVSASTTFAVGPGLGTSDSARTLTARALAAATPLVLDADALNLLAADAGLQEALRQHQRGALLTPHPLEAARLLGLTAAAVQADRLAAARTLAQRFGAMVVLKGSGSVIAEPDGMVSINPTGNPALATGGTGDVLTGVCGALLAQGWPPPQAAQAAVWLHGAAADRLVAQGIGPAGLTAGELVPAIRSALNLAIEDQESLRRAP